MIRSPRRSPGRGWFYVHAGPDAARLSGRSERPSWRLATAIRVLSLPCRRRMPRRRGHVGIGRVELVQVDVTARTGLPLLAPVANPVHLLAVGRRAKVEPRRDPHLGMLRALCP